MALLKNGSRGAAVMALQQNLNKALIPSPRLTPDGVFGPKTEAAVRLFQRQSNISVDGIAGSNTQAKLTQRLTVSSGPALRSGNRGSEVANLQRLLNAKSPHGPRLTADGVFGSRTQTAVMNFQRNAGLTVDGIAGSQTMAALNAAATVTDTRLPAPVVPPTGVTPADITSTPANRPYYKDIVSVYGDPQDHSYIRRITPPFPLYYSGNPVSAVSMHEKVADSMSAALQQILGHYGLEEIERLRINHNYGGSLNKRLMRGGSQWSTHSWGVAIDLNAAENQLRWGADRALFAKAEYKPMIDIFESYGWYNLGRHKNFDFMHFQAVRP